MSPVAENILNNQIVICNCCRIWSAGCATRLTCRWRCYATTRTPWLLTMAPPRTRTGREVYSHFFLYEHCCYVINNKRLLEKIRILCKIKYFYDPKTVILKFTAFLFCKFLIWRPSCRFFSQEKLQAHLVREDGGADGGRPGTCTSSACTTSNNTSTVPNASFTYQALLKQHELKNSTLNKNPGIGEGASKLAAAFVDVNIQNGKGLNFYVIKIVFA